MKKICNKEEPGRDLGPDELQQWPEMAREIVSPLATCVTRDIPRDNCFPVRPARSDEASSIRIRMCPALSRSSFHLVDYMDVSGF